MLLTHMITNAAVAACIASSAARLASAAAALFRWSSSLLCSLNSFCALASLLKLGTAWTRYMWLKPSLGMRAL